MTDLLLIHANYTLFKRYKKVCEESSDFSDDGDETCTKHLAWMCDTILDNLYVYPIDKQSRWLGYVQGCLTMRGLIDVTVERNFSRPLFHASYMHNGEQVPPTRERKVEDYDKDQYPEG